ncbi:alpha-ketoglutarate dehydrogenase component 4 isoform X2 [Monodelphis domestica]|uniref:Alpha-ketoglutarate dehydrogenase subunit 4 n=1 Tax=Monodelphis domestica TaxID=13616 RepID=F6TC86_MONDO|nr:alpha-ketoglutarate dehydrogenase component 4 isoform X2 [Monodelphis domestica]XP_044513646.1 28S ribosomal protein S36, mitochondrial isoform X2 [Gracilinanus agilis]
MGSKMAAATRVVQVVKPHIPLIRFPDRKDNPKLSVPESFKSSVLPSHSSAMSQHSVGGKSPGLPMNRGPPDTADIVKTLPQKYRRKHLSPEEIEFIQRGGPE